MGLPQRIKPLRSGIERAPGRRCPGHRSWVRSHACCVPGCQGMPIECAHVRTGTDGGVGIKPSDRWCISLCRDCHAEQHRIGEPAFERRHKLDMKKLAAEFARLSPHRHKLSGEVVRRNG